MARTAINPVVRNTPSPQGLALRRILAEDVKTWKRGELGFLTSGTVTPVVTTGKTTAYCIFAEDQTTSTSTTTVPVYVLVPGMQLEMFLTNNGTDAAWSAAYRGVRYGVYGKTNVSYVDVNTANGQFEVIDALSAYKDLEDGRLDMDAAPAVVLVEFKFIS